MQMLLYCLQKRALEINQVTVNWPCYLTTIKELSNKLWPVEMQKLTDMSSKKYTSRIKKMQSGAAQNFFKLSAKESQRAFRVLDSRFSWHSVNT